MEHSVCPVPMKSIGPGMKEPKKVDASLFQELILAGMAGIAGLGEEGKPEGGKEPGITKEEMADLHGDADGEEIQGLGHFIQEFMVNAESLITDSAEKEMMNHQKPMDSENLSLGKTLESSFRKNDSPAIKSPAIISPAVNSPAINSLEISSKEIPLNFNEESTEEIAARTVFKELVGSPSKQGSDEQEKSLSYLHQDGVKSAGEQGIKDAPKIQITEQVLTKNLETFETEMIKTFETAREGETSLLKIKLEPESLGKVDIQLRMEDGKLKASIIVENDRIRELFGDRLMELGARLNQQNIPVDELKMEVAQEAFQSPMNMSHEGRQGQQRHQQKMQYQNKALMKAAEFRRNQEAGAEGISILA